MFDANHSNCREDDPLRQGRPEFSSRRSTIQRSIARVAWSGLRRCVTISIFGATAFFLCQCHRQPSVPTPTPTPTPIPIPTPASEVTPVPSATASSTPTVAPTATPASPASTPPLPQPTASSTPNTFEEGIKQLLQSSENGFLEFRGKFKKTENGSGSDPLFRVRRIYEGTFLFGDATSAELEEVYYTAERQPAYNYHLYYQAPPVRGPIERYDDLRLNLNRALAGFEHTFGYRYDAWTRADPLKTAILLSSQDAAGSSEIQVHVAFLSPQW
jgi:hypothetical protein